MDVYKVTGSLAIGLLFSGIAAALFIGMPLLLIWCLNTLGITNASYGIVEWVAASLLTFFFLSVSGDTS